MSKQTPSLLVKLGNKDLIATPVDILVQEWDGASGPLRLQNETVAQLRRTGACAEAVGCVPFAVAVPVAFSVGGGSVGVLRFLLYLPSGRLVLPRRVPHGVLREWDVRFND